MELTVEHRDGIEARLHELGWIQPDERILALAPPGAGNMNRTLRVELQERTLILKQAVPFVARYPHIPAPVERLEVEAAFYRLIAGSDALALRTPRVLGEDLANHLLCLEDLGTGGDFTWIYQCPADDRRLELRGQLTTLFHWLRDLHALDLERTVGSAGLAATFGNHSMRALNHAHIFEIPFDSANGVELAEPLRRLRETLALDAALRERATLLGRIYTGAVGHASRPALLHGDYYPGSWLAHPRMGVVIIDPEFAFVGPPEFDVGVLLAHLIMAGHAQPDVAMQLGSYGAPPGFSQPLAWAFAGMEVIRRLLGVAQLPLAAPPELRCTWLQTARALIIAWEVSAP